MAFAEPQPLDIVLYPNPFLTRKCRALTAGEIKAGKFTLAPKESVTGKSQEWDLNDLVARMFVTMYANKGIGLAAPQIGVGVRLFIFDVSKDKTGQSVVINPVFSNTKGSATEEEGCLSIPDVRAKVKRFAELHVAGLNPKGEPIEADVSELVARVCQHENDHLDGVLFINKIGMTAKLMIRKQLMQLEDDYHAK
ncbi:MAG TPA: peptide deformylase [Planctomycetota bacterium]|nr:peptide deformylase [Planctomycetota bacterium]